MVLHFGSQSQRNEEAMAEFWEYLSLFFWYHRLVKLLLHLSTGQCELQRICYKRRRGALRTGQVGKPCVSLLFSEIHHPFPLKKRLHPELLKA